MKNNLISIGDFVIFNSSKSKVLQEKKYELEDEFNGFSMILVSKLLFDTLFFNFFLKTRCKEENKFVQLYSELKFDTTSVSMILKIS